MKPCVFLIWAPFVQEAGQKQHRRPDHQWPDASMNCFMVFAYCHRQSQNRTSLCEMTRATEQTGLVLANCIWLLINCNKCDSFMETSSQKVRIEKSKTNGDLLSTLEPFSVEPFHWDSLLLSFPLQNASTAELDWIGESRLNHRQSGQLTKVSTSVCRPKGHKFSSVLSAVRSLPDAKKRGKYRVKFLGRTMPKTCREKTIQSWTRKFRLI